MSEYDDIKTLQNTGSWPNGAIPVWAYKLAREYITHSTDDVVLREGLLQEIRRLRQEVSNKSEINVESVAQLCDKYGPYVILHSVGMYLESLERVCHRKYAACIEGMEQRSKQQNDNETA